jgi:hypothetical protein
MPVIQNHLDGSRMKRSASLCKASFRLPRLSARFRHGEAQSETEQDGRPPLHSQHRRRRAPMRRNPRLRWANE